MTPPIYQVPTANLLSLKRDAVSIGFLHKNFPAGCDVRREVSIFQRFLIIDKSLSVTEDQYSGNKASAQPKKNIFLLFITENSLP